MRRRRSKRGQRGIIIADTKMEFGIIEDNGSAEGQLILIDELLTAGLVALLGYGDLRAGQQPAQLRQAVRP